MNDYTQQLANIKSKLKQAKKLDKHLKVFGASSHKYKLGKPVKEGQLEDFERKYMVELPACYKSFITRIGNGGVSFRKSAAGPFYGIYPFGTEIDELAAQPGEYLSRPPSIYPDMTDESWNALIDRIENEEELPDEDYDQEMGKIFAGILPIGSQGCTYLHGLILSGEHRGKVVNLDHSLQKPKFTFEANFLDWYERWLDEILAGELLDTDGPKWFGYSERKIG